MHCMRFAHYRNAVGMVVHVHIVSHVLRSHSIGFTRAQGIPKYKYVCMSVGDTYVCEGLVSLHPAAVLTEVSNLCISR